MTDQTEAQPKKKKKKESSTIRIVIEALLIAALVHTLLFRPFFIPSSSMKPNLLIGDYLIINKFSYGYSRFSCYFAACPISGRIFERIPERGDVVVFANPGQPKHHRTYVKRLIGLPGDRIEMKDGILYINGNEAPQSKQPFYSEPFSDFRHERVCTEQDEERCYIEQSEESLPNGVAHNVLNFGEGTLDNGEWVVPEGHYFMMGDNRDNSNDSRADVGLVPAENLIGKAKLIVFSSSGSSLFQFWKWRSDRFFKWVE